VVCACPLRVDPGLPGRRTGLDSLLPGLCRIALALISISLEQKAGQSQGRLRLSKEDIVIRLFRLATWTGAIALIVRDYLSEGGDDRCTIEPKTLGFLDQLI
jgi:hypothetical protein